MNAELNVTEVVVLTCKLANLKTSVANLARRARRLGVPEPVLEVTGPEHPVVIGTDEFDEPIRVGGFPVRLTFAPIKVEGGWKVRAVVDHTSEGNLVRPLKAGDTLPEGYATIGPVCEHCNTTRRRERTFVCVSASGLHRLVGSSCLREFCGIDPELALFSASYISLIEELGWDAGDDTASAGARWDSVNRIAAIAAAAVRAGGWVSRTKAEEDGRLQPTADVVRGELRARSGKPKVEVTVDDWHLAGKAIEWALALEGKPELSDFENNLLVVARHGAVPNKLVGVAAYLPVAYQRAEERRLQDEARRKQAAGSKHVGTVGERLRGLKLTPVFNTSWDTQFGTQYLTKLVDADGNVFVVKSSNPYSDIKPDQSVDATVKAHSEREGCKQTEIGRLRVK